MAEAKAWCYSQPTDANDWAHTNCADEKWAWFQAGMNDNPAGVPSPWYLQGLVPGAPFLEPPHQLGWKWTADLGDSNR